jgi:hypothetical protein
MAEFDLRPSVTFEIKMTLSEEEALALDDIMSYGADDFLKTFKDNLGSYYIKKHENGLRSLFESSSTLKMQLRKVERAKESLK